MKSDSNKYHSAKDDVLSLFDKQFKICRIVHNKSGLYFNGFSDPRYQQGKNTLSATNFASVQIGNHTDEEILDAIFHGHTINRNGVQLVHNNIVYAGSEIAKILSAFYDELDYLPVRDFIVERHYKMTS